MRGLTEGTHGNAVGLGNADIMPRALLPHVDLNSTYMNAFTAKRLSICKVPMLVENELQALQVLLNFRPRRIRRRCGSRGSATPRCSTSCGRRRRCSTRPARTRTSRCSPRPAPIGFDESLALTPP